MPDIENMAAGILAIIVLYKCSIAHSSTCVSMQAQEGYNSGGVVVMVYDNGPSTPAQPVPADWLYIANPDNPGLSAAYNYALSQAQKIGARWLLLLDQDSRLPPHFLATLQNDSSLCDKNPDVAAIVPVIFSKGRQVSPVRPIFSLDRPYRRTGSATSTWLISINSTAAVRLDFIESIGGFTKEFWLDYLDHWLFRKIYDLNKLVFVSQMVVEHDLSVADFNQGLDISRYRNVLQAEAAFTNQHLPFYWRIILAFRLVARATKHSLFTHDKRISALMLSAARKQFSAIFN